MASAIDAAVVRPALLYEGVFDGGTVNLWTGITPLSWDAKTWTAGGNLLSITPIGENNELRAEGFEVKVSGIPSTSIAAALLNMRQGKPGRLWLAAMDSSEAIIADPYELQEGKLDVAPVAIDGTTATIAVRYESILIDLDRPRDRRYTNEDQQIDHPGDTGFRYVPKLQDAVFMFGGPGAAASILAPPPVLTNAR